MEAFPPLMLLNYNFKNVVIDKKNKTPYTEKVFDLKGGVYILNICVV